MKIYNYSKRKTVIKFKHYFFKLNSNSLLLCKTKRKIFKKGGFMVVSIKLSWTNVEICILVDVDPIHLYIFLYLFFFFFRQNFSDDTFIKEKILIIYSKLYILCVSSHFKIQMNKLDDYLM